MYMITSKLQGTVDHMLDGYRQGEGALTGPQSFGFLCTLPALPDGPLSWSTGSVSTVSTFRLIGSPSIVLLAELLRWNQGVPLPRGPNSRPVGQEFEVSALRDTGSPS